MRLALLAVVALFVAGAVPAFSSPSSVGRHGVSLRRVWMKPGAAAPHSGFHPAPLRVADPAAFRREKAAAEAGYLRWLRAHPTETGPKTGISGGLNHRGLAASDETNAGTPPDTTGAVGPDNYVEMVNSTLAVYSKIDLSAPTETIDESSFIGTPSVPACDGNIEWDQQGGRWLYSLLTPCEGDADSWGLAFGWSKTSSPSLDPSNWCQYMIDTHSSVDDYPKLGHDDSQILIGANEFGSGIVPLGYVLDKPANGDESCPDSTTEQSTAAVLTLPVVSTGAPSGHPWTPVPANIADSSAVGYVAAPDLDLKHIHLYTIGRDGSQANVLLNAASVKVPAFCVPPNVPQKGTKHTLESLDSRMTQAVAVTDPNTGKEGIWTQHTVSAVCKKRHPSGPAVVQWYELTPGKATPQQMGTVRGPNGAFAFMGAVSPSADGQNAAIFYNSSSSKTLTDFRVRDRHADTTPGSMVEDLLLGTSTNADKDRSCLEGFGYPCRWGDYNGASPDPSDPSLIWGTGELTVAPPYTVTHAAQWGSENAAIDVTPAATYSLHVRLVDARAGTGSVSFPAPGGGTATCNVTCSYDFAYGTPVEITAIPGAHAFVRWSGDCSGSGVCDVPMGRPQNVTATFTPEQETLAYARSGTGSGTVTFRPGGHCAASCSVSLDYGTHVRLKATAAAGSVFKGWSGACTGRRTCNVTMDVAKHVKAKFAKLR